MNMRNRKLVIVIRVLVGLVFLLSGVMGFVQGTSTEGVPPQMIPIMQSLWASGIVQMIKATEIVAGLMLVSGFYPALAAIFLAPICIGIIVINLRLLPAFAPVGVVLSLLDIYLGFAYWDKYRALFQR